MTTNLIMTLALALPAVPQSTVKDALVKQSTGPAGAEPDRIGSGAISPTQRTIAGRPKFITASRALSRRLTSSDLVETRLVGADVGRPESYPGFRRSCTNT